jgi:hypothetical protein
VEAQAPSRHAAAAQAISLFMWVSIETLLWFLLSYDVRLHAVFLI